MNAQHPSAVPINGPEAESHLAGLLAGYLIASHCIAWPGVDGLIVEEVLGQYYLPAANGGQVPNPAELSIGHPDLADAIIEFFTRYPA
jgi:hypothetical protein